MFAKSNLNFSHDSLRIYFLTLDEGGINPPSPNEQLESARQTAGIVAAICRGHGSLRPYCAGGSEGRTLTSFLLVCRTTFVSISSSAAFALQRTRLCVLLHAHTFIPPYYQHNINRNNKNESADVVVIGKCDAVVVTSVVQQQLRGGGSGATEGN